MAVSITQATEVGTLYQPEHIATISQICRDAGLPLHMDGARFANALVSLDLTPAEMTWKLGVDIVSFGGTKNGCWCAEALVFMDPARAKDLPFIRKRAAQLFSKTRFVAAQFDAYLRDDLWRDLCPPFQRACCPPCQPYPCIKPDAPCLETGSQRGFRDREAIGL